MLRRHLLFFVTGALLALAVVLVVRASDDGSAAGSAGRAGVGVHDHVPLRRGAARTMSLSVRLPSRRRALQGHRGEGSAATPSSKAQATRARGTDSTARPGPDRAGAKPNPETGTVFTTTVPDGATETVPGADRQTAEPPSDPGTGPAAPPADSSANDVATIPNPATPDASVGP